MTEFVTSHNPDWKPRSVTPESKVAPESIPITNQSKIASERVAKSIADGEIPTKQDINTLMSSLEQDLKAGGVKLTKQETKQWQEKAKASFSEQQPPSVAKEDDKLFEVSLPEYQQTFNQLSKTYGLDKHKLKFGVTEGLLIQGKAIDALAGVSFSAILTSLWSDKAKFPKTGELIGRYIGPKLVPSAMENHPQLGTIPLGARREHGIAAAQELMGEAKRFKWPLAIMLAYIPSVIGELAGRLRLVNGMKTVRQAVNERAANSLFMRDLEFVHDKSAAEINNIIEKGKQSTVNFFSTTYTEVIPRLATIGLATVGQLPINPIGATLELARLPFLYGMSKSYAKDVLKQRAADLKRKDMIDTRINATLGSLEIVKTSDSMQTAIDQLKDNMGQRDTFQMSSIKDEIKQEVKMDAYNMVFGMGIPTVASAINYLRTNKWESAAQSGIITALGGRIVEKNARELVNLYVDAIQPALQDIKRMEDLLGPYESLDKPDGMLEQQRVSVSTLKNFDISVRNLRYKNILNNVSLDVAQGSFVTLKGPSGSGKTTFMRHMLGLFGAGDGAVTYGGKNLQEIKKFGEESIYSAIGYANQNPQYFENMTLKDNLLLWTKRQISDEEVVKVLRDLRLDPIVSRLDSTVKHFSGGELRRIGIARALLKDPKVLFLDEPTANLDEASAKQVLDIIKQMRKTRPDMTVVAVTHDPNFEAIAEKIVDFAQVNTPVDTKAESLGNRQVFYAAAPSPMKN